MLFFPVLFVDYDLPVPGAIVRCKEYGCHSKSVDAFIHASEVVRVSYGDEVQRKVVEAEAKRDDFLGSEYD